MKKEKTIRTYQRRTKTGKVVTVKQHTAKYDAAEALKEAAKKKGAGDELENLKKKVKPEKVKVEKPAEDTPDYGFTADEFKAWYHWDQDADPKNAAAKKVEKALKAKMGAKGYKKYFDEMTDSYSSRGHNKAFKALDAETAVPKKDAKTPKSKVREDLPSMKYGGDVEKDAYSHKVATSKLQKEGFKLGKDNLYHHADGRVAKIDQKTGKWVVTPTKEAKVQKTDSSLGTLQKSLKGTGFIASKEKDFDDKDVIFIRRDGHPKASPVAKLDYAGGIAYYHKNGIKSIEGALEKFQDSVFSKSKVSKKDAKTPKERESAFLSKHAAKVEEWKKTGNVAGMKKEIAKIKLEYGNDREKAAKLIKPLEAAIAAAQKKKKTMGATKSTSTEKSLSAKRASASIEGLKDPKRDAAIKEMKRKDREYLKGVAKKAMFKNDPWFKRNGWTKQEKRNGNYSWISPDGNVSVPVTKLGMGAGKNFGTPKIKRSKE